MRKRSERKFRFTAKLHEKKNFLHVHTSKDVRANMAKKSRSVLVNKGDTVKVMRGSFSGKTGKVLDVDYLKSTVHVEGVFRKNARGKEVLIRLQPSNLLLTQLNSTKDRAKLLKAGVKIAAQAEKHEKVTTSNVVHVENQVNDSGVKK
ncbi:MAG: 50S ribosomal protein L24 [Candidatus Micrarchaeota archaeon]